MAVGPICQFIFYLSPISLFLPLSLSSLPIPLLGGHIAAPAAVPFPAEQGGAAGLAAAAAAPCCLLLRAPGEGGCAGVHRAPEREAEGAEGRLHGSVAPPSSPSSGARELHPSSPAVRCDRGRGGRGRRRRLRSELGRRARGGGTERERETGGAPRTPRHGLRRRAGRRERRKEMR